MTHAPASGAHKWKLATLLAFIATAAMSHAQLRWSSYDTGGNLVTANAGSGGDSTYGGSVTFTVPAGTQLSFVTRSFVPLSVAAANSAQVVSFQVSASGSVSSGRCLGWGLFNSANTAAFTDDIGYFGLWNAGGPYNETCVQPSGSANLFSGVHQGQGGTYTGTLTAGPVYNCQIQLDMNSTATGISLGTGGSTLAAAGLAITGNGVTQYAYCNAIPPVGNVTSFDEFAFMFYNSSASAVTVTLSNVSLVPANPVISAQPLGYSGIPGDTTPSADFNVALNANSVGPFAYQWYRATASATNALTDGPTGNGSTISGSTTSNLVFTAAQAADTANYFVVVTNVYGAVMSAPALLNIVNGTMAPVITSIAPATATVVAGNSTNFIISANGAPSPFYYWYDNSNQLRQASASQTFALTNVQLSAAGVYLVVASNSVGTASTNFSVVVSVAPVITGQPSNQLVNLGDPASFTVVANGVPSPNYQWYRNSAAISAATNATYSIPSVAATDTGIYDVTVSNAAGSVTSSNAVLLVKSSTMAVSALAPANGASGVCYDTPLYITFNQPPTIGTIGSIRIYNVTNSVTPVETIAMSAGSQQPRNIGGDTGDNFFVYPVIVSGNTAAIYPHEGVMTSNQTYYVLVDNGVFLDSSGAFFGGISASNSWQFTTKPTGPLNKTNIIVAADGTGDFVTVQGAIDSVPMGNSAFTAINIRDGLYQEIVNVYARNNLLLRGQSRSGTMIGYANNNNLNANTHTRMVVKAYARDISFDNLTITNLTSRNPQEVQAEALMIESGALRVILNNCDVDSFQDTILANQVNSRAYFKNCLVQGDVDFIWGGGNLFFTNCEIRYLTRPGGGTSLGPNPSPTSTDINSNGFSFVNCAFTTMPGANPNDTIGRTRSITNANMAMINCLVSTNIGGWSADAAPVTSFRNWYFHCTNDFGAVVTLSNGIALADTDVNLTNASSAGLWLYDWQPGLSPNIITQPINQIVNAGQNLSFAVSATGIPDPAYQWMKNGTNLIGQTGPTLTINSANGFDVGSYSVVVSNSSGVVISSNVTLNVNPPATPPTLGSITALAGGNVQFAIGTATGSAGFGYRVWATTNLSLLPVTDKWTMLTSGVFEAAPAYFMDTGASNWPQRFYMVTVP